MIKVPFTEPSDDTWKAWLKKAVAKTEKVKEDLQAGRKVKIDGQLYKAQRDVFLGFFHDKCAYCEAKVTLDQHYGDVEHYRPKGRITDESGKVLKLPARAGQPARDHPGYPWLAYDPHNLLPSCRACNQPATTRQGKRVGKWDQFPVAGRYRAAAPGDETREKPLLLHPGLDDPSDHLVLDPLTGILGGKTKKGRTTIQLLNLNREGLPEERRKVFISVKALVLTAREALDRGELQEAKLYLDEIAKYRDGSAAWSWPGRLALDALGAAEPEAPARDRAHEGRSRTRRTRRREPGRIR